MSFEGADVDGLDHVAHECTRAACVCDEVRTACEIIVAAASLFGPFGAAFIAYLKAVVIPWLQKAAEALTLFARVLSAHSAAQRDASSSATSLPSYSTPAGLPAANTADYPPIAPGSAEFAARRGAVMNRDALDEFAGQPGAHVHPTITLGRVDGEVAVLTSDGAHVSTRFLDAQGGAASWFGHDPKDGYQLGAGVHGAANIADVKVFGAVPVGSIGSVAAANETTVGANADVHAGAGFNPATGTASASASAQVFAGVQNTTSVDVRTEYFADRTELTGQLGAGAAGSAQIELGNGHLIIHESAGVAVGLGGSVSTTLDVDYDAIATDIAAELDGG